jgi:hypothetical protein
MHAHSEQEDSMGGYGIIGMLVVVILVIVLLWVLGLFSPARTHRRKAPSASPVRIQPFRPS